MTDDFDRSLKARLEHLAAAVPLAEQLTVGPVRVRGGVHAPTGRLAIALVGVVVAVLAFTVVRPGTIPLPSAIPALSPANPRPR